MAIALLAGPAYAQSGEDYVVRFTGFLGDLRFGSDDLRAELSGEEGETAQVAVALDTDATASFAQFSRTHLNQTVTMFICGVEVARPSISAEITSGFAISDPLNRVLALVMVDALNGLGACPE